MQRVISIVRTTLQDLQLAIDGTIIMSEVSHSDDIQCRLAVGQHQSKALPSKYSRRREPGNIAGRLPATELGSNQTAN